MRKRERESVLKESERKRESLTERNEKKKKKQQRRRELLASTLFLFVERCEDEKSVMGRQKRDRETDE